MIKKRTKQTGSAHVVIIVFLLILLLAALGVVFYQNFIAKTDETARAPTAVAPAVTLQTARVAFNSSIYELDYPKGWTAATTKLDQSDMGGSTTTMANPNKTIQVSFRVSELGSDNACDTTDGLKISHYKVYPQPVEKLTDTPLYLVETISDHAGGGYQYKIGLTPDGGDTHAVVGDSHCNSIQVGRASSVLVTNGQIVRPTIVASIDFPGLPAEPQAAAKDMQMIKDRMATSDYSTAVNIIESARKKN